MMQGVQNTAFIPLAARIAISKEFPHFFYDKESLKLEVILPKDIIANSSQYTNMASVSRYYAMDRITKEFVHNNHTCNIVLMGSGLETCYYRLDGHQMQGSTWYYIDLEDMIKKRNRFFKPAENEIYIPCDVFDTSWYESIDNSIPTLFIASGLFQYFHKDDIIRLIGNLKEQFRQSLLLFDATDTKGLRFANRFVKRSGNDNALMHFAIDDAKAFASQISCNLVLEEPFYKRPLEVIGKELKLSTRLIMRYCDKHGRTKILLYDLSKS